MTEYDVFISFKYHDSNGATTRDFEIANELYAALKNAGKCPFFSEASLVTEGTSQYKRVIDNALDTANTLIVVGTSVENIDSTWVRYEWDGFINDIISGIKPDGNVFTLTENISLRDLPRPLRQVQGFEYANGGLESLCSFMGIQVTKSQTPSSNNASYAQQQQPFSNQPRKSAYSEQDMGEAERLELQFSIGGARDIKVIEEAIAKIGREALTVLDVGCASGYVTNRVFSDLPHIGKVVGIDKSEASIKKFNEQIGDERFTGLVLDIEAPDAETQLQKMKADLGISGFDIIYIALTLHHLSSQRSTLRMLRHHLNYGGICYVRSSDDGSKLAYPDPNNVMVDLINRTASLPIVSDRFHGRKLYGQLVSAGFENVKTETFTVDTASRTAGERYELFKSAFSWRKNYFKKMLDYASGNQIEKAVDDYTWASRALDELEEMFYDPKFYCSFDTIICIGEAR